MSKLTDAIHSAAHDVNQWLASCGYDDLTLDQRELLIALDFDSMDDCDSMLSDLEVRVGVSESDIDALRRAVEDYRAAHGKGAI